MQPQLHALVFAAMLAQVAVCSATGKDMRARDITSSQNIAEALFEQCMLCI